MKNQRPRQLVIEALQHLPSDASWQAIRHAVKAAAAKTLPEEIINRTAEVFGCKRKAIDWLVSPNRVLEYLAPIDVLEEDHGVKKILTILGRIEHGIFS